MDDPGREAKLADPATMGMVLGWVRSAVGRSPEEESLVAEVYRRIAHDCPRWLRKAPVLVQLKSLTVITLLEHNRGQRA